MVLWKKYGNPSKNVTFYGFTEDIDFTTYLPAERAKALIDSGNGIALDEGSTRYYANGAFGELSGSPLISENGVLMIDGALLSGINGVSLGNEKYTLSDAAAAMDKNYTVYEDKLVVFTDRTMVINAFDNYYTLEMMSMCLRGAAAEDMQNALMMLPSRIGNGTNLSIHYTDPNLELGLQTTLYDLQARTVNAEEAAGGPEIVAGEGKSEKNHTIIRVYNKFQSKIAQFLAFPTEVTGGVKVAGTKIPYGNGSRSLIAAAAYNTKFSTSKSVRVFDAYGVLYMEIVPEFVSSAPYNILMGNFSGDETDELLIAAESADKSGDVPYAIYSLTDGSLVKEGKFSLGSAYGDELLVAALDKKSGYDQLLLFASNGKKAFTADPGTAAATALSISLPIDTNGVYVSSFGDGYVATIDRREKDEDRSYLRIFNGGDLFGTELDVGKYENIFYWYSSFDPKDLGGLDSLVLKDTDYVKYAPFQHQRTDLQSKVMLIIRNDKSIASMAELPYSEWAASGFSAAQYHLTYNVWEPCFTHRWNGTAQMNILNNHRDKDGDYIFSSIGKDNDRTAYTELNSAFLIGTYADGIIELDKLRIYPLRSFLDELWAEFKTEPEKLAGLEPIHEIEINVEGSVGDYNKNMIEGFRAYLLTRFGSVENINNRFGTSFTSRESIDAPRDGALGDRGVWDRYEGDYFEQWCIYTRQIINKRLAESFREALLAGFPPEIISGHSIPEGDAISGFLGQADTRMSPVDAMMTLGCGFGVTRYGTWYKSNDNFLLFARNAGFKNITISEYNSISVDMDVAYEQLLYIFRNGGKYINMLNVSDPGSRSDMRAVAELIKDNQPRSGNTGGTLGSIPVTIGDSVYNIVQLGEGENQNGLLKSINEDGTWEGSVYLTPFHSHIVVEPISLGTNARSGSRSAPINDLQTGDVIEVNFTGSYSANDTAKLIVEIYEDEVLNESLSETFVLSKDVKNYKYVLSNQAVLGTVRVVVRFECEKYSSVNIEQINGSVQRESVARKYFGDYTAEEHRGGVTFDVLTKDMIYGG